MLLSLDGMHERHRALTESVAGSYQEAAAVCLSRHHMPPVHVTIFDNGSESSGEIIWTAPDARTLAAWANTTDTTEAGACACVIEGVEKLRVNGRVGHCLFPNSSIESAHVFA